MKILLLATLILLGFSLYHVHSISNSDEASRYSSRMEEIIKQVNEAKNGWNASKYPRFHGLDQGNLKHLFRDPSMVRPPQKLKQRTFNELELSDVPSSFDSRKQWPSCKSLFEIRNQGNCGSCWAVSSAGAMSDRWCISSGQKDQTRISQQDILSCCFACGNGCDGGFPSEAWFFFQTSGLVSGDGYNDQNYCKPYTIPPKPHLQGFRDPTPECLRKCQSSYSTPYFLDKRRSETGFYVIGEKDFKRELVTNGPIVASFLVYEDFINYKSGVYTHVTGEALGGHDVRLIGYGTESNGVNYWLFANSWGPEWGENGYFRIRRGTNECGIEAEANGGDIK